MNELQNKERLTLNFRKNPATTMEKINRFLKSANQKKYGKSITLHEVIADCVGNYGPKDMARLQDSTLSPMDRVKIRFDRDMEKSESKLSFEEYLAKKLGVK